MRKQLTDSYSILSEFLQKSSIFLTMRIYKSAVARADAALYFNPLPAQKKYARHI